MFEEFYSPEKEGLIFLLQLQIVWDPLKLLLMFFLKNLLSMVGNSMGDHFYFFIFNYSISHHPTTNFSLPTALYSSQPGENIKKNSSWFLFLSALQEVWVAKETEDIWKK